MRTLSLRLACAAALLAAGGAAWCDESGECAAHGGMLLTSTVIGAPRFAPGHERRGVELSHTHVRLRGDDGRAYDIAIDNVFAAGYGQSGRHVPPPLSQIRPHARLEVCGRPYRGGGLGMDFVHSNCGQPPTPETPDGWVKLIGPDGVPGPNLEASQAYCGLFRRG